MKVWILKVGNYLGLAPLVWFLYGAKKEEKEIVQHSKQALALSLLFLCCLVIFLLCFILHQIILFASRDFFQLLPLEISFYILGVFLFLWLTLWLSGIISALRNNRLSAIPLVSWITGKNGLLWFAALWTIFFQVSVTATLAGAIHSTKIVQSARPQAEVYVLYDDMGYIPEWVFSLGFYRVSLTSFEKWGEGSVKMVPLTVANLNQALQSGRFVYVASHGAEGRIYLDNNTSLGPEGIKQEHVGAELQYVYLSGCDTGYLHTDWEKAFGAAEVKTFARLSSTSEHIIWLLIDGPKIISELQD
jgi:hypothetical protein